jgi:virginiamycin B lyase
MQRLSLVGILLIMAALAGCGSSGSSGALAQIRPMRFSTNSLCQLPCVRHEYPTSGNPKGITSGPDGNLWITETGTNEIGRLSPNGELTEFPIPSWCQPNVITAGADSNLWFTACTGHKNPFGVFIGRITTGGVVTTFGSQVPSGITSGDNGTLWYTENVWVVNRITGHYYLNGAAIVTITTGGVITGRFFLPRKNSNPTGISRGPDNNLWFTEMGDNKIGRITYSGKITEFSIPTANSAPDAIAAGQDGNLWFTEIAGDKIGRITPGGAITEFAVPTAGAQPAGIASGGDGNVWFTEHQANKVGEITPGGVITEFVDPNGNGPAGITLGPDGNLWFADHDGRFIGEFVR